MPRFSLCVIAGNEEDRLGDCLASAAFADELLVVDSRSADRTREVAREAGARVIERDWPGFVKQRQFAIEAAAHDWILALDADERLSPELAAAVREIQALPEPPHGAYRVARLSRYLGRWLRHGGWYPGWRVRLFDRRRCRQVGHDPHEHVEAQPGVSVGTLAGDLHHLVYRDIADHLRTVNSFSSQAAAGLFAAGRRRAWPHLFANPPLRFLRAYVLQAGFLDGLPGLVAAALGATQVFLKYAKLLELRRHFPSPASAGGSKIAPGSPGPREDQA